jgi:hypothetical protein
MIAIAMTAPCEPETSPEPSDEDQEIILRLGDILPRVPPHLLKPGPHDTTAQVRFSIEELAEKISRGRVSVPLQRLASACPNVFRESTPFLAQEEISLPLQKLLEQVGLAAPKQPSPNGIPKEQLAQARAEASRILEANAPPPPPDPPAPPPVIPRIAKALATARHILGVFGRQNEAVAPGGGVIEKPVEANASQVETQPAPAARDTSAESPSSDQPGEPGRSEQLLQPLPPESRAELPQKPAAPPQTAASDAPADADAAPAQPVAGDTRIREPEAPVRNPEPTAAQVPEGFISLRALPIFRLLPAQVLRSGMLPPEEARVALPLSTIDPQLAEGHVEIPLDDFIKALPEGLREGLTPVPDSQVWIPLDEVFQNLPPHHLFYMPPLDFPAEPGSIKPAESPSAEAIPDARQEAPPAEAEVAPAGPAQALAGNAEAPEQPISTEAPPDQASPAVNEASPLPAPAAEGINPEAVAVPASAESVSKSVEPETASPAPETVPEAVIAPPAPEESVPSPAPEPVTSPQEPVPEAASPSPAESAPAAPEAASPAGEAISEIVPPLPPEPMPAESTSSPAMPPPSVALPATPPSRAPWTRGFQVPPPRLFSAGAPSAEPPAFAAPAEPPPPPAATPEAKHTADFLASQPGIFASAAFVQGAVFASADFPRKPDLDALRDFMGAFIESARESGRRLGWNRVLTIPCEQFHLTAVVRDSHFIVALHHDRLLSPVTYDALIAAADDLSKAAG